MVLHERLKIAEKTGEVKKKAQEADSPGDEGSKEEDNHAEEYFDQRTSTLF